MVFTDRVNLTCARPLVKPLDLWLTWMRDWRTWNWQNRGLRLHLVHLPKNYWFVWCDVQNNTNCRPQTVPNTTLNYSRRGRRAIILKQKRFLRNHIALIHKNLLQNFEWLRIKSLIDATWCQAGNLSYSSLLLDKLFLCKNCNVRKVLRVARTRPKNFNHISICIKTGTLRLFKLLHSW